jgi:hypothetical protein
MPRRGSIEESIYDLIPQPAARVIKPKMHRSRFPGDTAPTASTFGSATGSQIPVTNVGGNYSDLKRTHNHRAEGALYGKAEHFADPTAFQKKKTHRELPART